MDDHLKAKLLEYMGVLEKAATKAGEFAQEEVPQTLREYLSWHFWDNAISGAFWLVLAVIVLFIARHVARRLNAFAAAEDTGSDESHMATAGAFFCRVVQFLIPAMMCSSSLFYVKEAIKTAVAPRVVLVEKAASVFKSDSPKK